MPVQSTNVRKAIKDAIRTVQTGNSPATENDVLHAAEVNNNLRPVDVKQTYESLRKRGEIYSYPNGGVVVVKITDEVL